MRITNDDVIDIMLGLHSGIPKCCVYFYVAASSEDRVTRIGVQHIRKITAEYVLCNSCLAQTSRGEMRPVTLHKCKKGQSMYCDLYAPKDSLNDLIMMLHKYIEPGP